MFAPLAGNNVCVLPGRRLWKNCCTTENILFLVRAPAQGSLLGLPKARFAGDGGQGPRGPGIDLSHFINVSAVWALKVFFFRDFLHYKL